MSVEVRLKKQNSLVRQTKTFKICQINNLIYILLKTLDTLATSAALRGLNDHRRQPKCMMTDFFRWLRKTPSKHQPSQEHTQGGRSCLVKGYKQKMPHVNIKAFIIR